MASNTPFASSLRLTYGITPPKAKRSTESRRKTAALQTARINALPIDALVVYDLQDESSRTDEPRPFPFLETVDSLEYASEDLADVAHRKIVYRCVSQLEPLELGAWLSRLEALGGAAMLVGAPSRSQPTKLGLGDAYRVRAETAPGVPLGGVLIAERHESGGREVSRLLAKQARGCSFFISQTAYSTLASKNLLSDLYYECQELERPVPPILVSLSPCGSLKTLAFLEWLGVLIPRWLRNELEHSNDILAKSVDLQIAGFAELYEFASAKGIPLGCNIESVSLARAEIEASVEMVHRAAEILGRG